MIKCKGEYDYWGEFDCGWGADFGCEDCIINGGTMSPQTNKPFRGNRAKYEERAREKPNSEHVPDLHEVLELVWRRNAI